ncbi:MAG: alpha-D-glucose phosphate-specific phosphoglucomutase [Alphaproteobacteria bacterium]|nr:alpha-D-glucose phosphate-specific phosphoglucomutase [Alphaproteobacteria bacterium]
MMIKTIATTPYTDQKMGTAGLRKKSKVVMQPNYVENFMQSIFNTIGDLSGKVYLVGGDGRFYNDIAIQKIIKMAAANGVAKLIIGKDGFISTPAGSHIILKNKADGGFVLSASHNPGGENGDFGIKYANESGGQAPSSVTDKIYQNTKEIKEYKIFDAPDIDLSKIGTQKLGDMVIEIIDPVTDYVNMMQEIFDFEAIKKLFRSGFTMRFDAMNAVTGPYAQRIFEEILGAPKGSVVNFRPLPDFGGLHPDPNLIYAKELVDLMFSDKAPDFGAANDGDGDRNMILGKKFFVTPSDSLAILTDNYQLIPAYKKGIFGVAKSAATSSAVSRVAKAHNIGYYEVPTGWKYFVNLMDSNRITFCGEESFGTGSSHIREKDGIWAVLFWLNIIAVTGKSVEEITLEHWKKYGRSYYMRFDFEGISTEVADKLMADLEEKLPSLNGRNFGTYKVSKAAPFVYNDPVDHSSTKNGLVITFEDGSRIVYRLSGTGSSGATLRVYLEKYETEALLEDPLKMLKDILEIAMNTAEISQRTGKQKADVIT